MQDQQNFNTKKPRRSLPSGGAVPCCKEMLLLSLILNLFLILNFFLILNLFLISKHEPSSLIQTLLSVPESPAMHPLHRKVTGSAADTAGRGLYRRLGLSPDPEDYFLLPLLL